MEQTSLQFALHQPQQEHPRQQEQQCRLPLREHWLETGQDAAVVGNGHGG